MFHDDTKGGLEAVNDCPHADYRLEAVTRCLDCEMISALTREKAVSLLREAVSPGSTIQALEWGREVRAFLATLDTRRTS